MFDFNRAQRRSYYQPTTNGQTTSSTTDASGSTAVSTAKKPVSRGGSGNSRNADLAQPEMAQQSLAPPGAIGGDGYRPATPSDRTGAVSQTGYEIERQILNGGGMANMSGRGGWRHSELPGDSTPVPMRTPSLSHMSDKGSVKGSSTGHGQHLDAHGQGYGHEDAEVIGDRAPARVPSPLRSGST